MTSSAGNHPAVVSIRTALNRLGVEERMIARGGNNGHDFPARRRPDHPRRARFRGGWRSRGTLDSRASKSGVTLPLANFRARPFPRGDPKCDRLSPGDAVAFTLRVASTGAGSPSSGRTGLQEPVLPPGTPWLMEHSGQQPRPTGGRLLITAEASRKRVAVDPHGLVAADGDERLARSLDIDRGASRSHRRQCAPLAPSGNHRRRSRWQGKRPFLHRPMKPT